MRVLRKAQIFVLIVFIGPIAFNASGQTGESAPEDSPKQLSSLAQQLKDKKAGLTIVRSDKSSWCEDKTLSGMDFDFKEIPPQFVLAALARQAIYIDNDPFPKQIPISTRFWRLIGFGTIDAISTRHHSKEWQRSIKAIKASGYVTFHLDPKPFFGSDCVIAIPRGFVGKSDEVDTQLDFALTSGMEQYFVDDAAKAAQIDELNKVNEQLSSAVASQQKVADELQRGVDEEQKRVDAIWDRVRDLRWILRPNGGFRALRFSGSGLGLKDGPQNDFLKSVLASNLKPIPPNIHVTSQVSDAYLQPELIDTLERFLENNKEELADIGLSNFALASAARTPLNQLGQQSVNDIAAGMFVSGHVVGAAFDFHITGTGVDVKTYHDYEATPDEFAKLSGGLPANAKPERVAMYKQFLQNPAGYKSSYAAKLSNWNKLAGLMAKNGLLLKPGLKDANHVFLAKYKSNAPGDRAYQNHIRTVMLRGYLQAMKDARAGRDQALKGLKNDNQQLVAAKFNLDQGIANLQKTLEDLHNQETSLSGELARLRADLQNRERSYSGASHDGGYRPGLDRPQKGSDQGKTDGEQMDAERPEHGDHEHAEPSDRPGMSLGNTRMP